MELKKLIKKLEKEHNIRIPLPKYEDYETIRGSVKPVYFDSDGKISDENKADFRQGILIHGEYPMGGENYKHSLYFAREGQVKKFFKIDDNPNYEIIKMQGNGDSKKTAQMWHHFKLYGEGYVNHSEDILRRFREAKIQNGLVIVPYHRGYDRRDTGEWFASSNVPPEGYIYGDDGIVAYDSASRNLIWIDKLNKSRKLCGFNIKPDSINVNGSEVEENDHIDFLGMVGDDVFFDSVGIIDIYSGNSYKHICLGVNPFVRNGGVLEDKVYNKDFTLNYNGIGPQTIHEIKMYDLKKRRVKNIKSFSDPARAPYYWYVEPARLKKGNIEIISRDHKEKFEIK